jgi:hypothetical protein
LAALPQPTNSAIPSSDFQFAVTTCAQSNAFCPPGVTVGTSDSFALDGFSSLDASTDLWTVLGDVGIRIQSLPEDVNEGSLFLVGTERPVSPNGNFENTF